MENAVQIISLPLKQPLLVLFPVSFAEGLMSVHTAPSRVLVVNSSLKQTLLKLSPPTQSAAKCVRASGHILYAEINAHLHTFKTRLHTCSRCWWWRCDENIRSQGFPKHSSGAAQGLHHSNCYQIKRTNTVFLSPWQRRRLAASELWLQVAERISCTLSLLSLHLCSFLIPTLHLFSLVAHLFPLFLSVALCYVAFLL